jgi:nucleotide-binding universal stress UspA family protein
MIPEIKKILYATDHSKNSAYAFYYAIDIARRYDARIVILHVVEFLPRGIYPIGGEYEHGHFEIEKIDVEQIKNYLQKFCQKTQTKIGSPCVELVSSIIVHVGYPVEEILNVTDEEGCDLIILGTHGKGFLKRSFLGSVSNAVLHRAQKPVLLIPLPFGKITINWDEI